MDDLTRGPGRPSKFTPEIEDRLLWLLSQGFDVSAAAERAGIGRSTFYDWLREPRPEFRGFRARAEAAVAAGEVAVVENIVRRSRSDWRAGFTWLRIRYPERWAPEVQRTRRRPRPPTHAPPARTVTLKADEPIESEEDLRRWLRKDSRTDS